MHTDPSRPGVDRRQFLVTAGAALGGASLLKACGNCAYSDGLICMIHRAEAVDTYPGNSCDQFEFRRTRAVLH